MTSWLRRSGLAFLLALAIALYFLGKNSVERQRRALPFTLSSRVLLLPPTALHLLAGEFKGVFADYLILEAGSYLGSKRQLGAGDIQAVLLILRQALELDPRFQQSYLLTQGHIPWLGHAAEANTMLDMARRHRSWDWRPGYYMGFNNYFFLRDTLQASSQLLQTAADHPDAPSLLSVLGARLAVRGHDTTAAIAILESMLANQPERDRELTLRLTALRDVQAMEQASRAFQQKNGRFPEELTELVQQGFLDKIPENPYDGECYAIEPVTGQISFDAVSRKPLLHSRQANPSPPFAP